MSDYSEYITFVTNTLNVFKNHSVYGPLCQRALEEPKWKSLVSNNDYTQLNLGVSTYVLIYRTCQMSEKLLMLPKNANVLCIVHKFNGNIPPSPTGTNINYQIGTIKFDNLCSNALLYRWESPKSMPYHTSYTVGDLTGVKSMLRKGYSILETYDLKEHKYSENIFAGTYTTKHLTDEEADIALEKQLNFCFYRFVLEQLMDCDASDKCTPEMSIAIKDAIDNCRNWMALTEKDDAVYYKNGSACVCIKYKHTDSEDLDIKQGRAIFVTKDLFLPNQASVDSCFSKYSGVIFSIYVHNCFVGQKI